MCGRSDWRKGGLVLASVGLALATTGCGYMRSRGSDALDMFDLGVTWTKKPQFGLYANCPFLAPAGYAKVDGTYAGIGGGRFGVMEHHQDNVGLLAWGREDVHWRDGAAGGQLSSKTKTVGPVGFLTEAAVNKETYDPTCAHYLHLGYVGVTGNIHYAEIADFFLGWAGLDISRDDARAPDRTAALRDREPDLAEGEPQPATEFCPSCGGRRLVDGCPPVPSDVAASSSLPAAAKRWAGKWCECWQEEEHRAPTVAAPR